MPTSSGGKKGEVFEDYAEIYTGGQSMSDPDRRDDAEAHKLAEALGLNNLSELHLKQLLSASRVAAERRLLMNTDSLIPADEPALIFRLP